MSQTPLLQISVLIIQHFTIDKLYDQRKYEQGKESSSHQTADDDYGQRALRLRTDAMAYGCGIRPIAAIAAVMTTGRTRNAHFLSRHTTTPTVLSGYA